MSTEHQTPHQLTARQAGDPTAAVDVDTLRGLLDAARADGLYPWRLDASTSSGPPGAGDVIVHDDTPDRENPLHYQLGRTLAVAAVNALPALLDLVDAAHVERAAGKPLAMMVEEVNALNTAKGWRDDVVSFGDRVSLLAEELGEMVSAWRTYRMCPATADDGRPLDVPSEIADLFIRLLDMCTVYRIDLAEQFRRKMAYNWTRPYQHGGRTMGGDLAPKATQLPPACASLAGDLCTGPADTIVVYRSRLTGKETDRTKPMCIGHADHAHRAWNGNDNLAVTAMLAAAASPPA